MKKNPKTKINYETQAATKAESRLPELPAIAHHLFRPEMVEKYSYALCDILCWLDGFKAAGGTYAPGSIETLRNLSCAVKDIQAKQTPDNKPSDPFPF